MGFDLNGTNDGTYFRANVWWWRPLWDYVVFVAPDIAGLVSHPYTNDGDGLDGDQALALANIIKASVVEGRAAAWASARYDELAQLPLVKCPICDGTNPSDCGACGGNGTATHPKTRYRFSVEFLGEFATFLTTCGGFEIW